LPLFSTPATVLARFAVVTLVSGMLAVAPGVVLAGVCLNTVGLPLMVSAVMPAVVPAPEMPKLNAPLPLL
jgi:hypothetical protein